MCFEQVLDVFKTNIKKIEDALMISSSEIV